MSKFLQPLDPLTMPKQLSRADVVKIVKQHFAKGQVVTVSRSVLDALDIFRKHKNHSQVYTPLTSKLIDRVILGEYYKVSKRQRRKRYYQYPPRQAGRPNTLQADIFLISRLAYLYAKHTGKKPTFQGNGNFHKAPFETFATEIMKAERVFNPRGVYREFAKRRKTLHSYQV